VMSRPQLEQEGDPAALAVLEYAAGYLDLLRLHCQAAQAAFTRSVQHARQAGDLWFETSIGPMAASSIYTGPTPVGEALQWLDDAEAQYATYQPQLKMLRAGLLAEIGRFDEARSLLSETSAWIAERGLTLLATAATETAWGIEMLAGDAATAERAARQGWAMLEQLGGRNQLTTLAAHAFELADALYALGRYEESGRWALRGLELGSNDDLMTQSLGRAVQSRLLARQGDLSAALTMAVEIDDLARTWDSPAEQGDTALNLAEVLYLAGDRTRADEMTQRAIDCYLRKGATARAARAQRLAAEWACPG